MIVQLTDRERCHRIISARDARFDGALIVGVRTTGIYCRPSCPARTPHPRNVEFFATAAAAQRRGFRACKRCRPDAVPGSPEWDARDDLIGRIMRHIRDGVVDREGVAGLASHVHVSERHLHRVLVDAVGAGPMELATAQRIETVRLLVETTNLPFARVAFASGFSSVRQFNDAVKRMLGMSPREWRAKVGRGARKRTGSSLSLRLALREPFHAEHLIEYLRGRAIGGMEFVEQATLRRTLHLPNGVGAVRLRLERDHVLATLKLDDLRDLQFAVQRCRQLLDLDADPQAVDERLATIPELRPSVNRHPGMRAPGSVDPFELVVRAVVGQQVSVAGARTVLGRIVAEHGVPVTGMDGLTRAFPTPAGLATIDPQSLPMPRARAATLVRVAEAMADDRLLLHPGVDRDDATAQLLAIRGIGPWTARYVRMRSLGDPDVLLDTDLAVRHALERLGADAGALARAATPWGSYATFRLWSTLAD